MAASSPQQALTSRHGMAPLIRFTLVGLYLALVLPLPPLAPAPQQYPLVTAVVLGLLLVLAITSERVEVDSSGIRVDHPAWCRWWLRRGWDLAWSEVASLQAVGTSQGGRVYYLASTGGRFLVPQRVERFSEFLAAVQQHSGLATDQIQRISPPWTYQLLAGLTALMLVGEGAMALALATGRWGIPAGVGG